MRILIPSLLLLTLGCGCGDTNVWIPTAPDTPAAAAVVPLVTTGIEFRVSGNASSARVRFSTPADGLSQVITTLPYTVRFTTTETSLFLSLEVTPLEYRVIGNPFLSIQIVAGGVVFREATANDLTANTLAVSGTWRR